MIILLVTVYTHSNPTSAQTQCMQKLFAWKMHQFTHYGIPLHADARLQTQQGVSQVCKRRNKSQSMIRQCCRNFFFFITYTVSRVHVRH